MLYFSTYCTNRSKRVSWSGFIVIQLKIKIVNSLFRCPVSIHLSSVPLPPSLTFCVRKVHYTPFGIILQRE